MRVLIRSCGRRITKENVTNVNIKSTENEHDYESIFTVPLKRGKIS